MKNMKLIAIGLLALLIATPVSFAKGNKGGDCPMKQKDGLDSQFLSKAHYISENADQLGLTDEQTEKIKTLKSNVKKDLIKREAEIEVLAIDITDEIKKRPIDTEKVNGLIDQKYDLKKSQAKQSVDALAELKSLLTDEQYEALKKLKDNKKDKKDKD